MVEMGYVIRYNASCAAELIGHHVDAQQLLGGLHVK